MMKMTTTTSTITTADQQPTQDDELISRLSRGGHFASYPPIEKFMTLDGLLRSHATEPDEARKPLICYPAHGVADFEEHTAASFDRYTDAAVRFYIDNGIEPADPDLEKAPVVALLVPSSFEAVLTIFALNRLGYALLFLSTRLTAPACARLLGMANCYRLIVPESSKQLVQDICTDRPACTSIPILRRQDWLNRPRILPYYERNSVDPSREGRKMAWVLHSSGSTGFPKPIFLTNLQCLANFRKSFGLRAFCISPLFHLHGLNEIGRAFYTRAPIYLGNHSFPVTSQNLVDALEVAKPQQVSVVPYLLKLLAEKREGIDTLARANLVLYAGSSCPDDLGDRLVASGVNLVATYASTETGQVMTSFRPPGDKEWQYMRLHRPVADYTLMDEIAPGVFECVALDGLPSKVTSNSKPPYSDKNPKDSFRTADIFTRHPDPKKSNYYKYLSRLDDRITLVNGEKVLPIPLEGRIREEKLARECVVFGFQRTVPGALVFRDVEKGAKLSDDEFLNAMWPAIEVANMRAETYSRIPKELVVVKGAEVAYPRTDKGTFIRAQVYQQFADDIRKAYSGFEAGGQDKEGLQLSASELENWLLTKFRKDLGIPLPSADSDIFAAGVDSLQTTRIWRYIVRDLDLGSRRDSLNQNVVFEKGTVRRLANYLYHLRTNEVVNEEVDDVHIMEEMIEKYSHFTKHFPATTKRPEQSVVIVTGATGNLGAFIVAEILERPDVAEVWALVRAPGRDAARARVLQFLAARNIHPTDLGLTKLRAIPSDFSQVNLGLCGVELEHLLSSATCVIHSAWAVNVNLGVRSFEAQHIRGTYNLINFCLRSRLPEPARFFFCSSVSTASATPKPAAIPETIIQDLHHAQGTG